MRDLSKFSFGITSAITTSLALMLGLNEMANPRISIIGALMIIAIADNISDSLGIHVYRESECAVSKKSTKFYSYSNFLTRFAIVMLFIAMIALLPLEYGVAISVLIGVSLLSILSYFMAVQQKTSPLMSILHHLGITIIVLVASHFLGQILTHMVGI